MMSFFFDVLPAIGLALGASGTAAAGVGAAAAGTAAVAGTAAAAVGTGFSLSTALSIGSAALGVVGSLAAGSAGKQSADYNAQVMEQQALVTQQQGASKATEIAVRNRQKMAAIRGGALENGLELSGSVNDVLDTANTAGTLDQITALYDSTTRASGLRQNASMERVRGDNAMTASYINAGTSLLSGFSKAYGAGNRYRD